jgi:hypothetical protein
VSYYDGDNLQLRAALNEKQREPDGFYASCHVGGCAFCSGEFFGVTLTMIAGSIEESQFDGGFWNYLWLNENTETELYNAVDDDMRWPAAIHKTPKGPMLQHDFGPFPMRQGYGEFMQKMLIDMWAELRSLVVDMASSGSTA